MSTRLSGLTPGTSYHYRLVAASKAGAAFGGDAALRRPALPPTIVKESSATASVRDTKARVTAVVAPNGLATTWSVRYGTSVAYGAATPAHSAGSSIGEVALGVTLAKLSGESASHYQFVATNAVGTSLGSDESFSTTGPPLVVAESSTGVTPTTARLTGALVPDGHPTTWHFQYGTAASYGSRRRSDTPAPR